MGERFKPKPTLVRGSPVRAKRPDSNRPRRSEGARTTDWNIGASGLAAKPIAQGALRRRALAPSERPHHNQNHNPDHQHRRNLVHRLVELGGATIFVPQEPLSPEGKNMMHGG